MVFNSFRGSLTVVWRWWQMRHASLTLTVVRTHCFWNDEPPIHIPHTYKGNEWTVPLSAATYCKGELWTHVTVHPCAFSCQHFQYKRLDPCSHIQPLGWNQLQQISKPEDQTTPLDYDSAVSPWWRVLQDRLTFSYLLLQTDCWTIIQY